MLSVSNAGIVDFEKL